MFYHIQQIRYLATMVVIFGDLYVYPETSSFTDNAGALENKSTHRNKDVSIAYQLQGIYWMIAGISSRPPWLTLSKISIQ